MKWSELEEKMSSCFQSSNQSIKQHGLSVYHYYSMLFNREDFFQEDWKLPDWFLQNYKQLFSSQYDLHIMREYLIYHDCGKPFVFEIDDAGKNHFPNHAQKSFEIWNQVSQTDPKDLSLEELEIIGQLILHDMDLHTMTAEQVDCFIEKYPKKMVISLLLAGLAEIHSNAAMWGGISSTSFKIKWKQLDRRGRQICFKLFGRN